MLCPLTTNETLRIESDQQTATIQPNFPKGVAKPALRALLAAGFTRLEELTRISESELLELHGMGPKAVTALIAGLKARGLDLKSGPPRKRKLP